MKKSILPGTSFPGVATTSSTRVVIWLDSKFGIIQLLCNHFPEVKNGLLRPEVATIGCCRRQQHLWDHRNPFSRPEGHKIL